MATETLTHGTQQERDDLAMDIAFELDKIARALPEIVPSNEAQAYYLARAIGGRMLRLTHVLMTIFDGDETYEYKRLRAIVTLEGHTQG